MAHRIADLLAATERGPVTAFGANGPLAPYVAARLLSPGGTAPRLVVVVPDPAAARRLATDLAFFLPALAQDDPAAPPRALVVPAIDTSPYAELAPDRGELMSRLAALYRLAQGGSLAPDVIVLSATALLRRVVPATGLLALARRLRAGDEIDRDHTAAALIAAGYSRAPVVEDPGTFAVRGGVLDVYPALYEYPVRIDLFGDDIESMRLFDPHSQRTLRAIDTLHLPPARDTVPTDGSDPRARIFEAADAAAHPSKETRKVLERVAAGDEFVGIDTLTPAFHPHMDPLWRYLGDDATYLVLDPDGVRRAADDELELAEARYDERLADHRIAFAPAEHYVGADELMAALAAPARRVTAPRLEILDGGDQPAQVVRLAADDNQLLRSELERARHQHADELIRPLVAAIRTWRADGHRIAIACDGGSRRERLLGLLRDYDVDARTADDPVAAIETAVPGAPPTLVSGDLSRGFTLAAEGLVLLTCDDIFGQRVRARPATTRAAKRARDALLGGVSDFSQLQPGDFLVHTLHGVGQYKGLAQPLPHSALDFLHLEYRDGTLYLPIYRLGEVQRYVGAEGLEPRIDRLGGVTWQKARGKVSVQVRALAEELLQLYAQRAALPGYAFPPADSMFREFEATFAFEETPDQQRAIDEVLADMEADRPMDRLVCGDVGYGKTEIALRAAFRAALGGRQVAILAPTTVLVEQHYRTMVERFEGWPVQVAKLSRFQPRKEQLETIRGIAENKIDVVVGTHRLLSKDVRFADLGLIVVDEEQRFGVTHKERLKAVRTQVDVLTLTATPIPRTLHLAMAGLRDLSIIATPPADRRSIRTFVSTVDDGVLREGLRRELGRGGQVFFVSPRISEGSRTERSLHDWAEHLRGLVPDARVVVAHGQMPENELEKVMVAFVAGDYDILVSTTIIEAGLDIPRANTMFIANADDFGLAQLYQLRGRIGRSRERAFCYLLVPPPEQLTDEARRRLEVLQRYTELGAGFQIASHDLEIRGAGDLLGRKQSGSIAAIGFEAYTAMLEDAVGELRGEPIRRARDPELNVEMPGFIPDDFVPDTGQRLDLYKRLASADDEDEIQELVAEIRDRYGPPPVELMMLADTSALRIHARRVGAQSVDLTNARLSLALAPDTPLAADRIAELVARRGSGWRLTPDMRLQRQFDPSERNHVPSAARRCLLELLAHAT
ncbi:MAG TPA: transcription-repair coupling factor [Kofleriaceae bacterium]|nr:transcription-repair coupling factor [Kofleriaceae bacterium]